MLIRIFTLSFLVCLCIPLTAQDSCFLKIAGPVSIQSADSENKVLAFSDIVRRKEYLDEIVNALHADGYLAAAWIQSGMAGDTMVAGIDKGSRVRWATLRVRDADIPFLEAAGYRKAQFQGVVYDHRYVAEMLQKIANKLADSGYPFAVTKLDSVSLSDSLLTATIMLQKNTFIQFDSVKVIGSLQVSGNFIQQYTGIMPGQPYDQSLVEALPARIRQLSFASVSKSPVVEFSGNQATIIIYAEERRTSRFDFVLGVLPNNAITGRLIITGDLQLQLQNVFDQGEQIYFQYNKLESSSKSLQASFAYPYLPKLPIGPEARFYLYLKDSTFLERKSNAGLVYQIAGNHTLKAFATFFNSSVLRPDTTFALANFALPAMLDVQDRSYGLEWQLQKLDFLFNPRKGFAVAVSGAAGTRSILENASIAALTSPEMPDYDFASLYDSIDTRIFSSRYSYDVQWFIPVLQRSTLLIQGRGASLLQEQLLDNELLRIGGNNLLRGFDEQSIPVSDYHIGTIEFRYLLAQRSYAALFADGGYILNRAGGQRVEDYPYGFGAGIRFETKAGIFGLTYALGGRQMVPVEFRNTKVHFGYVNFF